MARTNVQIGGCCPIAALHSGPGVPLESSFTSVGPAQERQEGALGPYLRAIRAHRLLVAVITLVAVGAAGAWLAARSPTYQATAEILITPLPQGDPTLQG